MAGGQANGVWETAKTLGFGCLLWKEGQTWVLQRGTNGACYLYLFWGWHFLHLRQMKWSCKLNKGVLCVHLRTKLDETRENLPNIWVFVDAGLVHPPLCGWWVQMSIITLVSSMCVILYIYIYIHTYSLYIHKYVHAGCSWDARFCICWFWLFPIPLFWDKHQCIQMNTPVIDELIPPTRDGHRERTPQDIAGAWQSMGQTISQLTVFHVFCSLIHEGVSQIWGYCKKIQ